MLKGLSRLCHSCVQRACIQQSERSLRQLDRLETWFDLRVLPNSAPAVQSFATGTSASQPTAPARRNQPRSPRAQAKQAYHDKLKASRQQAAQNEAVQAAQPPSSTLAAAVRPAGPSEADEPPPRAAHKLGKQTTPEFVNCFVELNHDNLGEAFQLPAADFFELLPKGGCKGIQEEMQATNTKEVLYRQNMQDLIDLASAAVNAANKVSPSLQGAEARSPDQEGIQGVAALQTSQVIGSKQNVSQAAASDDVLPKEAQHSSFEAQSSSLSSAKRRKVPSRQAFLRGPISSGKSTALAVLVDWARANGWVVLYLPAAAQLTHGGFFKQHESGGWDTPESAKLVLHGLASHHKDWLEKLHVPGGTESLWALSQRGLQDLQGGDVATQAALDVVQALYRQTDVPLLVAIDGYDSLYRPSEYGQWLHQHKRRLLDASELRLAASMRLLQGKPPKRGMVVCADGNTTKTPQKICMNRACRILEVPRFNRVEWEQMLAQYYKRGVILDQWSREQVSLAYQLTGGNLTEVRKFQSGLMNFQGVGEGASADNEMERGLAGFDHHDDTDDADMADYGT